MFSRHLEALASWLEDEDQSSKATLLRVIEDCDAGRYDQNFSTQQSAEKICLTTSCHLLAMALRHGLEGLSAEEFYKCDPTRYVRTNLLVQRVLGIRRLTLGWPVYAFGAEVMGQKMMYPDDQAPGSDPGYPLLHLDDPESIPEFDPHSEIANVIRETLLEMARLGEIQPVAHLPAPYSLAAEIVGQENLILAVSQNPDGVVRFLDVLVDRVLAPWCRHLYASVPSVWLELSDASGSPMFIGPGNFLEIAVDPVLKLRAQAEWGDRVFVANYRGDTSRARRTGGRRSGSAITKGVSFEELLEAKRVCCPWFVTRLEADSASLEDYSEYCIENGMTLFVGIGATRTDRNSITNREDHIAQLLSDVSRRASAISNVARKIQDGKGSQWPGALYLEDTNVQSDVRLISNISETLENRLWSSRIGMGK